MSRHRRVSERRRLSRHLTFAVIAPVMVWIGMAQPAYAPPVPGPFHATAGLDTSQVVNGQACDWREVWLEEEREVIGFCAEGPWWR